MTDRYERIRDALAMGPTPGPWAVNPAMAQVDAMPSTLPVCKLLWPTTKRTEAETWANGQIIAACDPDTIRTLLEERDQLAAALSHRAHPAITFCDNCGCDWLDNGLNPVSCPYCAIRELMEERDELAKDAARYRWLRDPCSGAERVIFYCRGDYGRGLKSGSWLDAAIDDAMGKEASND